MIFMCLFPILKPQKKNEYVVGNDTGLIINWKQLKIHVS
jgi:hypothetical protein